MRAEWIKVKEIAMSTKGKYHISDDGVARKCQAEVNPCKYATGDGADNHYDTREQAQAAYEQKRQNDQAAKGMKKSSRSERLSIDSVETAQLAYDEQGRGVFESVDLARDYYKTVYAASGNNQLSEQYRQLRSNILDSFSSDTHVINLGLLSGNWETGRNGGVAFRPLVGIPRDFDESELKKTADELEPRLKVNAEILGGRAGLSIIEDHLSKAGSFGVLAEQDTESSTGMGYTLYHSGHPLKEKHEHLVAALKDVSEIASYNEDGSDDEEEEQWGDWYGNPEYYNYRS